MRHEHRAQRQRPHWSAEPPWCALPVKLGHLPGRPRVQVGLLFRGQAEGLPGTRLRRRRHKAARNDHSSAGYGRVQLCGCQTGIPTAKRTTTPTTTSNAAPAAEHLCEGAAGGPDGCCKTHPRSFGRLIAPVETRHQPMRSGMDLHRSLASLPARRRSVPRPPRHPTARQQSQSRRRTGRPAPKLLPGGNGGGREGPSKERRTAKDRSM